MKEVKRIEIVIDASHTPMLLDALKDVGTTSYTLLRDVQGVGDRGERLGDTLTDVLQNSYVLVACPPEELSLVIEAVRPLIKQYGGVCLVSDAQWLLH